MSRNQTPISPNAPLSFKTVPGRHRTQKWNKAPSYNYDGDDWGGYDPYDEYGGEEEPAPPPIPSQIPSGAPRGRKSSFDRGDDTRQFSAPVATTSFPVYEERRSAGPGSAASGGRGSNDFPRSTSRPRDFTNPEQVPQPLMTKATPPPPQWFPPRKSSLGGNDIASKAQADEARAIAAGLSSANTDKPLPFIRPSDIYKRIPDEIRRQSEEGTRPSMESLQREPSPQKLGLEPVQESRESRMFMDDEMPKIDTRAGNAPLDRVGSPSTRSQLPSLQTAVAPPPAKPSISKEPSPTLPEVSRISGFGDSFFQSGTQPGEPNPTSFDSSQSAVSKPLVNTAGTSGSQTTFSSIQNTPTTAQVPSGNDATGLQHQPSQGFRSAVHQAFDRSDNSTPSRDSSQSGPGSSGVSRSDTNSTAGISPIMSRVPSAATAQFGRQQRLEEQVPSIAEEPSSATPTGARSESGLQGQHRIPRKPSPGHSRNVSGETATPSEFEPGYRRSLDPPSTGTSPARTPGMETTASKRLSTPMSAVPMTEAEAPDVADQAAEVPQPTLEPAAETPASEISQAVALGGSAVAAVASHTRGRSNTDYSMREADIAETVNSSPDKAIAMPAVAEAQRDSQKLFLETHPGTPSSPNPPGAGFSSSGTPTRADSPAKGRVREIADKYHQIHQDSRRNSATSIGSSKSSWSNFDAPRLQRQGTSQSQLGADNTAVHDDVDSSGPVRPEFGREESFKPDLPGGWISSAPTPALESPPVQVQQTTPRQSTTEEEVDLTPTTKKHQLPFVEPTSATSTYSNNNVFDAVKNAGEQLGASLLSTYGIGHQTRDFASSAPPAPIDQPETQFKPERGSIAMQPPLLRHETDSTDAPISVASSVAPTPPVKDTPRHGDTLGVDDSAGYFNTVAPLRLRSREPSPEQQSSLSPQRPSVMSTLSTDTGAGDMDSDRLRKEIVRSLDPIKKEELKRESIEEDAERTQDALDAPDNERRLEHGEAAMPAAEAVPPHFLKTKFSWEKDDVSIAPAHITGPEPSRTPEPEPRSPEIKPEMAYERPRTKALHVMNPGEGVESPLTPVDPVPVLNEPSATVQSLPVGPGDQSDEFVSPITKSQEHLLPETNVQPGSPSQSLSHLAPSPISENDGFNSRLPSYYLGAHDGEEDIPNLPEKDQTTVSSMSPVSTVQAKPAASIQPFRSILAMKSSDERIKTYNDTRQTFAEMNTGLNDWLSMMLEQHPEHANLSTSNSGFKPPAMQSSGSGFGTFRRGHKASPSIAKFANKFGGDDKQRSTSVGSAAESTEPVRPTPGGGDGPRIDMDKMQQRGKNLMKQAGMFGGKAQEGAKGLFAKGKSRFGGGGGSVRGKPGNEGSPLPSPSSSASVAPFATSSAAIVASPLGVSMATVGEAEQEDTPSGVHENSDGLVDTDNASTKATDTTTQPTEENITTAPTAPETPSQQAEEPEHIDTDNLDDLSSSNNTFQTTALTAAPAALPAAETPSMTAFVSPSPALAPLSRSTSSASPFRRPRSRTPSSTRTSSRPLSQVFDRLRDISRSSTRSRKTKGSRSRSRPTSLILSNPDLLEDSNEDNVLKKSHTTDFALGDFSDVAVTPSRADATRSTSSFSVMGMRSTERRVDSWEETGPPSGRGIARVMSMASPVRTEAWNEPDAQLPPPKTPEEKSGPPRRLGILPSPAPTATTFEEGRRASNEVARRRSSAVAWRPVTQDGGTEGTELATVPSERELRDLAKEEEEGVVKEELAGEERPALNRKSSDLAVLPSQRGDDEEPDLCADISTSPTALTHTPTESPVRQRPRKMSDLQLLPSQRRLSPLSIARPDSVTLTTLNFSSNESVDAEVHEASPVTIKPMNPPVVVTGRKSGDEEVDAQTPVARRLQENLYESSPTSTKREDEDLYESTPVATKMREKGWGSDVEGNRKVSGTTASTTTDFEDARSEVSAEEGAQQESSHHSTNPTTSRHSSVSSLGAAVQRAGEETAEETMEEPPIMSAQAVPAGPTGASPHTTPERTRPSNANMLQDLTVAAAARKHEQIQARQQLQTQDAGDYSQRFASRQYREQRPGMGERPMSYMPLPRDAQGVPVPETISTGNEQPQLPQPQAPPPPPPPQTELPVDLSNMTGPPPGAPPFSQYHAVRNSGSVQPTQYERLRSSVTSTGSGHTPQSSLDMGGRPPSGFFRGRPISAEHTAAAPPPSRISDQHGLEGVHAYGQVGADVVQRPAQQEEGKQSRRRSGLWESLTSRRSSAQRFDSSRESSVAPLEASAIATPAIMNTEPAATAAAEGASSSDKRKTLKKPQRASSSVVDSEPKKKRFSKLGSLFGRSSTTGGNATKPNRLTKNAPPSRENSIAQSQRSAQQQPQPQNSSTVTGSVRGYEAFEAMRRRDMPAFQENAASIHPPSAQAQRPPSATGEPAEPPPGGWYAPQDQQVAVSAERPMSPTDAPRPEFRRLHSEGRRGGERGLAQVPEAFRPVQASFKRPVEPIGPPPGQEPPVMRMPGRGPPPPPQQLSYPGQTPTTAMERMMDPRYAGPPAPPQRHPSYGSDITPPPISGRSEYYGPGSRPYGSLPSISPVVSRTGYERVNSIPEETAARSPAKEYADQQTPWAINLPQGGSARSSRASSWAMGMPPQQEYAGQPSPPPPPPQYRPPPPPQQQGLVLTSPANVGFYPPPPRGAPRQMIDIPWEDEQPIRRQISAGGEGPYPAFLSQQPQYQQQQQPQGYGYPPQQYPPQARGGPPQYYSQQPPPPPQNRFYARQYSGEYPPPQRQYSGDYPPPHGRPMQHRRTSSGYSGRRDEPAVGEDELIMRGASYPGQEWAPPGLGRSGWE